MEDSPFDTSSGGAFLSSCGAAKVVNSRKDNRDNFPQFIVSSPPTDDTNPVVDDTWATIIDIISLLKYEKEQNTAVYRDELTSSHLVESQLVLKDVIEYPIQRIQSIKSE